MADDHPSTIDPDGRLVVFDAGSHLHLAEGNRPWLLDHIETILTTVARGGWARHTATTIHEQDASASTARMPSHRDGGCGLS